MPAVSPIVGRNLGRYRIIEQVGAGGMGVVFRAHDERLHRDVALKILSPGTLGDQKARQRFRNEALTLSKFSHPNVAYIFDFDTQDEIDFLVMEFVEGVTLHHKLRDGAFPEEEVIRLGVQIANALGEIAKFGLVHRDLKPSNVVLTPSGETKLLDFGLAKLLPANDVTCSQGEAPNLAGTLPYMSPERLRGQPADSRTDIYSLGVVLYELATAKRPFDGAVPAQLVEDILHKSPHPPHQVNPSLTAGLEATILRCLAKEPIRRYQSAAEVRAALEAVESGARATPATIRGLEPSRRKLYLVALLVLIVSATVYLMVWHRMIVRRVAPRVNQLIILPLTAVSGDSEAAAFGNGLIQTLTSRLTRLTATHALQVVPASEILAKNVSSLREASEEFGANLGVELNIERAAGLVRVNYALIDAKLHQQIAGGTITASSDDPFGLEDKVSESLVAALQLQLAPQEEKVLTQRDTAQPAAFDYYLQGRGYLEDFHKPENVENAILEFNRALQYDPNYALALSGLGEAYWRKYEYTRHAELLSQARSSCQHAVHLNNSQAAGHLCLGLLDDGTGSYEKAIEEYKTAAELEPTSDAAFSGLAKAYQELGRSHDAEKTFRKAIALRPNYWGSYNRLGIFYMGAARYDDAVQMFYQVIALVPDSFAGYSNLGATYIQSGNYAKAIPALEHSIAIRPTAAAVSNLAFAHFSLKEYAQSARLFERASQLDPENFEVWGNLGDAYYWTQDQRSKSRAAYEKAVNLASKALQVNSRATTAITAMAYYQAMLGNSGLARSYIKQALRIAPNSSDVLFNAALIANQFGSTKEALNYLDKAVAAGCSKALLQDTPNFDNLRSEARFKKLLGPL
jgi:eukaryotic-like serine/threonine-protein kinase